MSSNLPQSAGGTAPLSEIHTKSLREQVLDALRTAILNGELKPGQPLVETELAMRLGVSRAPLREALQILSAEGLVETMPYRGAMVRALSRRDIEELYSLRGALEAFAVSLVAAQPEAAAQLQAIYEDMLRIAESGDLKALNACDLRFHSTLIALSGHSLLLSVWNNLALRVQQIMALRNERNTDLRQIARNHAPIVDAICAGDAARAGELLRAHAGSAADLMMEGWQSFQFPDSPSGLKAGE